MSAVFTAAKKPNLLLCLDAFGTLFQPSIPIPTAYAQVATRHGIDCGKDAPVAVGTSFKQAFKTQSKQNPNYGKATGLGATKWWSNVIHHTFQPFLKPHQEVPHALVTELLTRYSTKEGYTLYTDVKPLFEKIRDKSLSQSHDVSTEFAAWDKIVVGIITNSDDRICDVLESFGLKIGPRRFRTALNIQKRTSLKDDIDFVVLSYDVGVEKPDHRIFDAAVEMLKETIADNDESLTVESFEKLYVGDEVQKDYEGARAAGWHSLLLDRDCNSGNCTSSTNISTVQSLADLGSFHIDR